jgi:hypothetical protein
MISLAASGFASKGLRRWVHTVRKMMIDRNPVSTVGKCAGFSVQGGMQPLVASQSSALRFDIPSWSRLLISRFQHANAFVDEWQTDGQSKTFALATFDGELAAMLAHDAADDQ